MEVFENYNQTYRQTEEERIEDTKGKNKTDRQQT